jgi:hypothetical protein
MTTDLEPIRINGRYECSRLKSQKLIIQMRLAILTRLVAALLTGSVAVALHASPPAPGMQTEKSVEALALDWYANMQTGQINRTQLASEYNAQLTDDVVQATAKHLKEYAYGASPTAPRLSRPARSESRHSTSSKLSFLAEMRPASCSASTRRARLPASAS